MIYPISQRIPSYPMISPTKSHSVPQKLPVNGLVILVFGENDQKPQETRKKPHDFHRIFPHEGAGKTWTAGAQSPAARWSGAISGSAALLR